MGLFKKFIVVPDVNEKIAYETASRQFFIDVHALFISAGFVKSNTVGNMDFDNIKYPINSKDTSGYVYSPSYLEFDYNDEKQAILGIRIRIEFGLYKYNNNVSYSTFNIFRTTVGVIDSVTNTMINSKAFLSSYIPTHTSNNPTRFTNSFTTNIDSFIVNNGNITAFSIVPEYTQTAESIIKTHIYPIIEFVVVRVNDETINIYSTTGTNYTETTVYNNVLWKSNINQARNFFLYSNLPVYLTRGKLLTFPVYTIDEKNNILQNDSMLLCKKEAINTADQIDIIVDGTTSRKFVAMSSGNVVISGGSRLLVGVD